MDIAQLRELPSVNDIMDRPEALRLASRLPRWAVRDAARHIIDQLREEIMAGGDGAGDGRGIRGREELATMVEARLEAVAARLCAPGPRRVINATGVVLHTNLGRAPLPAFAAEVVAQAATGYCDLEFDLTSGERGSRQAHVADALAELTGAEAAHVVNNNAAAVLLCLDTLARGKQVVVSRGELVEIGGAFRVPEIMEKSGAKLVEVGTTNRTRVADYARAIGPDTGLLLKVHTSNFRVVGFTEEATLAELVQLGREHNLPVMYDLGSGLPRDLSAWGICGEPTVRQAVADGADVVTFSGDKLFGGPQAGIILGRSEMVRRIARNPLARALRIDKLTLTALACVVAAWRDPASVQDVRSLPMTAMLCAPVEQLRARAEALRSMIEDGARGSASSLSVGVVDDDSEAGGGSMPAVSIPGVSVEVRSSEVPAEEMQRRLRLCEPPVVARVVNDAVRLHMRAVFDEDLCAIANAVIRAVGAGEAWRG
ncbi:MAG: L-seryl-tRNA(Sec) selenium transferase [Bacillota bacterium]